MVNIKKSNRTKILEFIFRNGPISRATIAENTEITPATVTTTTAALIEENIIFDLGETELTQETTPGRKRLLLDLNPDFAYAIGIELTEKHICFCLTNLRGSIEDQFLFETTCYHTMHITETLIKYVELLIQNNLTLAPKIVGIGIAVPGKLDQSQTELISDSTVWSHLNIQLLKSKLGLPIILENNIRSMAYGQYLFNAKHCPENFSLFHIGIGMYCANMIAGELFLGNNFLAGEIGHTIVQLEGRLCECGKYGCLQTYASERALLRLAKLAHTNNCSPILRALQPTAEALTIKEVWRAHLMGDSLIKQAVSEALKYLSLTTSNLSIIMNPTKIFLHGELFEQPAIRKELLDAINQQLTFMSTSYAHDIAILPYQPINGAIGASAMAIRAYFILLQ